MNYRIFVLSALFISHVALADFGDSPSGRIEELESKVEQQGNDIDALRSRLDKMQLDLVNDKQGQLEDTQKLFGQLSDLKRQLSQIKEGRGAVSAGSVRRRVPDATLIRSSLYRGDDSSGSDTASKPGPYGSKEYEDALQSLRSGNYKAALASFREVKSRLSDNSPRQADLSYWMGTAYYLLGDYGKAIEFFNQVYEKWPKHEHASDALFNLVNSYYQTDQRAEAKLAGEALLSNYPDSAAARSFSKLVP